jgi:hypothetical protein
MLEVGTPSSPAFKHIATTSGGYIFFSIREAESEADISDDKVFVVPAPFHNSHYQTVYVASQKKSPYAKRGGDHAAAVGFA